MTEQIVLLNDNGERIGVAPKLESHHANTPLHLAFSCYVFNKNGKFLLTQRAKSKKVWPGVWTNTVCGHPAPNEAIPNAIRRRLRDELGIKTSAEPRVVLGDYRYKTPPFNGIIENEICPVYMMVLDDVPSPNPAEVEAYKWIGWRDLLKQIETDPDKYSYWLKDQLQQLSGNRLIDQAAHE